MTKQRREPKSTNAKYAENITPRKAKREAIAKKPRSRRENYILSEIVAEQSAKFWESKKYVPVLLDSEICQNTEKKRIYVIDLLLK